MLCNGFVPAENESAEDYFRPVRAAGNHMRRELAGTKTMMVVNECVDLQPFLSAGRVISLGKCPTS